MGAWMFIKKNKIILKIEIKNKNKFHEKLLFIT